VSDCEGICESCTCHVFHQYTLKISGGHRDALAAHLAEKQIPHGVYYPIPLHKQKAYSDQRYREEDFSVTNRISDEVLSLPMHTELTDEQIDYITTTIHEFLSNRG
jgi:dTDP-4-amino-4,6-dideoxygalactose transaminase